MSDVASKSDDQKPAKSSKAAALRAWWGRFQADPRAPAIAALHVFAFTNLAVAQPIFNLIAVEPMLLVVHRARPWEIVLVAFCLSFVLPLLLALPLVALGRWSQRLQNAWLLLLVVVFLFAVALPGWKRAILMSGGWLISLALITAALGTWLYWRFAPARLLVTYLALGGLLFPFLFVFRPPASLLVFPPDARPVSTAEVRNPAPVVMLVLDEFSMAALLNNQRQIDAEKFPNFTQLADDSTWYRNATSMSGFTQFAVPALLTGRNPRNVPATFASFPENLFTLLANQYELTVFEPYTTLCPNEVDPEVITHTPGRRLWRLSAELVRIYVQFLVPFDMASMTLSGHAQPYNKWSFERQRQKAKGLIRYNWSKNRPEQFEHFLETIHTTERPALYFGHIALPHIEYEYLPSGRNHGGHSELEANNYWPSDAWLMAQCQQRYLLQVAYVDRLLGRLLSKLKETGLYDRCLLVVMADHGITFRPGIATREATPESAPDLMWIPLFIKAPQQTQAVVSDRNMEIIDVLPTMIDLLEIRRPWAVDGISAADPQIPARTYKTLYRTTEKKLQFSADFPEKNSTLSYQLQWFSSGGGVDALYRIGANKELVGQSLKNSFVVPKPKWRVNIEQRDSLRGVTQQTSPWPCFLSGDVDEQAVARGPLSLAIAVDGRIQAVTRTYTKQQTKNRWQAMVPENVIHEGDNDVRVYVIRPFGGKVMLEPTKRD